jgi:predicted transcriptional regulator
MFNFRIYSRKNKYEIESVSIYRNLWQNEGVMNQQITIEISEQVWRRASVLAEQKQRKPEDVLEEWLEETVAETRIEDLTDDEVLALTELKFDDEQQNNFSRLLEKNRENSLNSDEKFTLDSMMRNYEAGLLRKSKALREAVERELIEPLS